MLKEIYLDCTEMVSPEPLNLAVENLGSLDENTYIKMVHRMEPTMLLNILTSNHYGYILKHVDEQVILLIWDEKYPDIEKYLSKEA